MHSFISELYLVSVLTDGMALDSSAPLLLYGYGAYGLNLDLSYDPFNALLLERGWTIGVYHLEQQ